MREIEVRVHRPYEQLARVYDDALGRMSLRATIARFERLVGLFGVRFGSAADVGCGTGLFAAYLACRHGVPVFAVDLSGAMLDAARARGVPEGVRLLRQDMRCLLLPRPVDLITLNFDSINHLPSHADLAPTIARLASQLTPGGHLMFDVLMGAGPLTEGRAARSRLPIRGGLVTQQIEYLPREGVLRTTVAVRRFAWRGVVVERHREVLATPKALGDALASAGLVVRAALDAETLRAPGAAPARLLVLARRELAGRGRELISGSAAACPVGTRAKEERDVQR